MLTEVMAHLKPAPGEVYVDGTFGGGGYSRAILDTADCEVVAIDRDPAAESRAVALKQDYPERFSFARGRFGDVRMLLNARQVDGFVLDIGFSSYQIEEPDRGFSFRQEGPLDMRMDISSQGRTAADVVNESDEKELADLIYRYGEERHSRRVAKAIAERRKERPFRTTQDLADIVRGAVPKSGDGLDPATRTFQALRIAVNDELGELERALAAAPHILKKTGRLIIVSFHSLEDKIIKQYLRQKSGEGGAVSRHQPPAGASQGPALFTLPVRKAVKPAPEEMQANPRARSARLRVAVRTGAPV